MWPFLFKVQLRKQETNKEQGLEYVTSIKVRAVEEMGVKIFDRLSTRASLRTGRSEVDLKNERTRRAQ